MTDNKPVGTPNYVPLINRIDTRRGVRPLRLKDWEEPSSDRPNTRVVTSPDGRKQWMAITYYETELEGRLKWKLTYLQGMGRENSDEETYRFIVRIDPKTNTPMTGARRQVKNPHGEWVDSAK